MLFARPFPKATIPPIEKKQKQKQTCWEQRKEKETVYKRVVLNMYNISSSSERLKKYHKDMLTMKS